MVVNEIVGDCMNDNFVDDIRDEQMLNKKLVKHWNGYNPSEVDAYVKSLQKQIRDTENVFQESYEDLRSSLLAITRERDELLKQVNSEGDKLSETDDVVGDHLSEPPKSEEETLKEILNSRDMIAMPKQLYQRLRNSLSNYSKKVKFLKGNQIKIEDKYNELLACYKKLKEENDKYILKGELIRHEIIEEEKKKITEEQEKFMAEFRMAKKGNRLAKEKSKEIFEIVQQCLVDFENLDGPDNKSGKRSKDNRNATRRKFTVL